MGWSLGPSPRSPGCGLIAAPALAAVPVVTTGGNGSVTYQSAVLFGTVNPHGASTEVYFQYGTTNKYGLQSTPVEEPAGARAIAVSIAVSGLAAGTVYHYRIVASNAAGTALGPDKTVLTAKIPLSLAITAAPNPVEFGSPVTIEGTLSGTGSAGAAVQLQENQFPYTAGFVNVGNAELTLANGSFVFNELGVALNTRVPRRLRQRRVGRRPGLRRPQRHTPYAGHRHPQTPDGPLQRDDRAGRALGADRVRAAGRHELEGRRRHGRAGRRQERRGELRQDAADLPRRLLPRPGAAGRGRACVGLQPDRRRAAQVSRRERRWTSARPAAAHASPPIRRSVRRGPDPAPRARSRCAGSVPCPRRAA